MRHKLLLLIFLSYGTLTYSQNFNGGILGGITASQVSGDELSGFNKLGMHFGAYVNLKLNEFSIVQMELSYIQKGSHGTLQPNDTLASNRWVYRLRLNYIEIPIIYRIDLKGLTTSPAVSKLSIEGGLAFGYLINSQEEDITHTYILQPQPFKNRDLSIILGLYYAISDNIGLDIRWSNSLLYIRRNNDTPYAPPTPGGPLYWSIYFTKQGQYNDLLDLTLRIQISQFKQWFSQSK